MAFGLLSISSFGQPANSVTITVENPLNTDRKSEVVSIPVNKVSSVVSKFGPENVLVIDAPSGVYMTSQIVDNDADGKVDEILFVTDINANTKKKFYVAALKNGKELQQVARITTFSRFVPERIDDYAWENDRVAFRTYGPVAQKLTEEGKPGGTLTSGMDCWLKRVDYPVIDKWYKGHVEKAGYYHIDHGEGYDPYHVGNSRGCGGIGIWDNNKLYISKNFVTYKTIAVGPVRTIFELTYAPWDANGKTITEKKRISLDLGSNLTRYEVTLNSDKPLADFTIGITLHEKKGDVKLNPAEGWFRYYETIDSSDLGTGIVIAPSAVKDSKDYRVDEKEASHIFVTSKLEQNKGVYYAGFAWKKSGQIKSVADWDAYLTEFAKKLAAPLKVAYEK